jgi:hypothetical protein
LTSAVHQHKSPFAGVLTFTLILSGFVALILVLSAGASFFSEERVVRFGKSQFSVAVAGHG